MFFFRKWQDHPAEAPGVVAHLRELRESSGKNIASGVAPQAKSAYGLFETDFDLFQDPHPGIRKLAAWVAQSVAQAVSVANGGRFKPEQLRVEIPEAWSHVTNDGGYHDAHYHGECSWCGIYYLQAGNASAAGPSGAGNGVSRFYSPINSGGLLKDVGNAYLSSNRIDITPTDGTLLLFPSYILHSGLPYKGQTDRVVIAFNSRSYLL